MARRLGFLKLPPPSKPGGLFGLKKEPENASMDPLSITVSVVALVGAIASTTKILARVIRLRSAPIQFVQLFDEVSDIQAVLLVMSEAAAELEAQGGSASRQVVQHLDKARLILDEISTIIASKIVLPGPSNTADEAKISKAGWFLHQSKIRAAISQLHEIRQNMHTLISSHTAKAMPRFHMDLQDIALLSREISVGIRDFETSALQRLDAVNSSLQPVHSSLQRLYLTLEQTAAQSTGVAGDADTTAGVIEELDDTLEMKPRPQTTEVLIGVAADPDTAVGVIEEELEDTSQMKSGPQTTEDLVGDSSSQAGYPETLEASDYGGSSKRSSSETLVGSEEENTQGQDDVEKGKQDGYIDGYLIKARVYRPGICRKLCPCRCHNSQNVKTPTWVAEAVGRMFLGYSGSPLLKFRSCSDFNCQQNGKKSLKIAYYFPRWFLDRMVELTCSWGPLDAHRIAIRTPRLRPASAEIFSFVSKGNLDGLRVLFMRGEASPFDVNAVNGRSALSLATSERLPDVCRFLLTEGANPEQGDQIERTPIDNVWNMMVREGRKHPEVQELVKVFNLDIEDGYDYLSTRKITPLHQVVMELKTSPSLDTNALLRLQLSFSDSADHLDAQDVQSRTPLHWAVSKGNAGAVKILLDAGASLAVRDHKKQTPIHLCSTVRSAKADCLEPLLYEAARRESAAERGRRGSSSSSLHHHHHHPRRSNSRTYYDQGDPTIFTSALLNDTGEYQGRPPLALATYNDCVDKVELLLKHEADTERADVLGRTPLLYAISRDAVRSVALLLGHDARVDAVDKQGSTVLHYAARYGGLKILRLLAAEKGVALRGLDVMARDKNGNTAMQVFREHRSVWASDEEVEAFQKMMASAATARLSLAHQHVVGLDKEDLDSSDVEQFFTAASSMEASSMENSLENLRELDVARGMGRPKGKGKEADSGGWASMVGRILSRG